MTIEDAYNGWAGSYDADANKTRDLDQQMTLEALGGLHVESILEIGCGTGKNTGLLAKIGLRVQCLDFSAEMLAKAKAKVGAKHVTFDTADLTRRWPVANSCFDLITCNLVLEHIEDLKHVFAEAARVLRPSGIFYVSELHPFMQYQGKAARYERDGETVQIPQFLHNISDFIDDATGSGLVMKQIKEGWHSEDSDRPPRLVTFVFEK